MKQLILDYGTIVAFGAIAVDLLFQIHRVWQRKSAADISLIGYTVRFASAFILLAKFASLADRYLVIGQCAIVMLLTIYFGLIYRYRKGRKESGSN